MKLIEQNDIYVLQSGLVEKATFFKLGGRTVFFYLLKGSRKKISSLNSRARV